mgnify:CR=1 FL=1
MSIVVGILVVLHLIGWAIALGGLLSTMKTPSIPSGVLHGMYLAVATGLIITGIGGAQDWDLNYLKIGLKLIIALGVLALALIGKKNPEKVTAGYLGMTAGLIVVNVFLAVLWK